MEDLSEPVLREYANDALKILERSLAWSRQEFRPAYRVVAAQLRLLLCDTTRVHGRIVDVSLAPRLIPDLRLHPACLGEDGHLRFDRSQARLPRLDWLNQSLQLPAAGEAWTLRDAIRCVCDRDGGVHVDPHQPAPVYASLAEWILAIGEYVLEELKQTQRQGGTEGKQ